MSKGFIGEEKLNKSTETFSYPTHFISEDYHFVDETENEMTNIKIEPNTTLG